MTKTKPIVADRQRDHLKMIFELVETGELKIGRRIERVYTYEDNACNRARFFANPNEPFSWFILEGQPYAGAVIEAFVDNGLKQHEFVGGWDEAISRLEIPIDEPQRFAVGDRVCENLSDLTATVVEVHLEAGHATEDDPGYWLYILDIPEDTEHGNGRLYTELELVK